jgi:hypothetical protein
MFCACGIGFGIRPKATTEAQSRVTESHVASYRVNILADHLKCPGIAKMITTQVRELIGRFDDRFLGEKRETPAPAYTDQDGAGKNLYA